MVYYKYASAHAPEICLYCWQVAAQTGHNVMLVDQNDSILQKANERIAASLKRVAAKQFPDDTKVQKLLLGNSSTIVLHIESW